MWIYHAHGFLFEFLNFAVFGMAVFSAVFFFCDGSKFKPHIGRYVALWSGALLLAAAGFGYLATILGSFIVNDVVFIAMLIAIVIFAVITMSNQSPSRTIYALLAAVILRVIVSCSCKGIAKAFDISSNSYLILMLKFLFSFAFVLVIALTIGKDILRDDSFDPRWQESAAIAVFIVIFLPLTLIEDRLERQWAILLDFEVAVVCFFALFFQIFAYQLNRRRTEAILKQNLSDAALAHAESINGLIDDMNIKIHDLKHHIRELGSNRQIDPIFVDELTEMVKQYSTYVKTGNQTIDVILTEKGLLCKQEGIELRVMLDGAAFSFLSESELYSLFGNAVDNAIEYLRTVPKECRYIQIGGRRNGAMVSIKVENYFQGALDFGKDSLPRTSKKDKLYHGFGTRSIAQIVRNHGGDYSFRVENGAFKFTAYFIDEEPEPANPS